MPPQKLYLECYYYFFTTLILLINRINVMKVTVTKSNDNSSNI